MLRADYEKELIQKLNETLRPYEEKVFRYHDRSLTGFPLPIRINEHDEYDGKIASELERYLQSIRDTPALMRVPGLLDCVQAVVDKLLLAIREERKGNTELAQQAVKSILEEYLDNEFFVSELDRSYAFRGSAPFEAFRYENVDYREQLETPLTFFRCRGRAVEGREALLHVPLSKRSRSSSNRFSLPGIPCLYLASTTYCCWEELGRPSGMSAACFRVNEHGKQLKILNLVISQRLINGVDWPGAPMSELALKMRILFPLVMATSISTGKQDVPGYKPEYTISHLIMRCLKTLGLDGVAYQSTRIDDEFQFPHGVNLALPVFSASTGQEYGEICSCFEMTGPAFYSGWQRIVSEKSGAKSYINTVFSEGFSATIDFFGARAPYQATSFSSIDNELAGKPCYPVSEHTL